MLASGEFLVAFASGQADEDYVDPDGNLHTDFKIGAGGEYLALTRPDESIAHEYAPTFPPQVTDVSYGLDFASTLTSMIGPAAPVEVFVPTDDSLGQQWIDSGFVPDGLWTTGGVTGVGYDENGDYDGLIGIDIESQMLDTNTSALIRVPFDVVDPSAIDALILRMQYDDGFVAYLNGQEVARRNAPQGPATLDYTIGLDVWLDGQDIHGNGDDNAGLGDGDDVWLMEGDPNDSGRLLRFADHHDFDATDTNVSLGRVPNGDPTAQGASLFPMAGQTFGAANGNHVVGDVVISEVMYHPAPVPPAEVGNINTDELEYVELTNNTSGALDVGGWKLNLTGGDDLVLPSSMVLPAGASLLLVRFDPVLEPSKAIAFCNAYSLGPREPLVGPFGGRLDNEGETVELLRPENPGNPSTGFVLVDRVAYDEAAPWPTTASGSGNSLQRTAPIHFGNFTTSWSASTPTPGSVAFVPPTPGDFDADGDVDGDDFLIWQASFGIDSGGDADGDGDTDGDDFLIWQGVR